MEQPVAETAAGEESIVEVRVRLQETLSRAHGADSVVRWFDEVQPPEEN